MNNKTPIILLASLIVSGCDYDPAKEPVQRDVYKSLEACLMDWGDKQMCIQAAQLEQKEHEQMKNHTYNDPNMVYFMQPYHFYGPQYVPGSRMTYYNGQEIKPRSYNAIQSTPKTSVQSSNFSSSRSSVAQSRGGFGSAGRSAGSSSVSS